MNEFHKLLTGFLIVDNISKKTGNSTVDDFFAFIGIIFYAIFLICVIIFLTIILFTILF